MRNSDLNELYAEPVCGLIFYQDFTGDVFYMPADKWFLVGHVEIISERYIHVRLSGNQSQTPVALRYHVKRL